MILIDALGNTVCVDEETGKRLLENPLYKPFDTKPKNPGKESPEALKNS